MNSQNTISLSDAYTSIYTDLNALREAFHRSGRLDDSNAKLDEVSKLFAVCLAAYRGQIQALHEQEEGGLIDKLREAFAQTVALRQYQLDNGVSIFGAHPSLVLREGDEPLARQLTSLAQRCISTAVAMRRERNPFDILNEAFGHFIRDNFRGNVEDAQYMTPPEVVEFAVDIALEHLATDRPVSEPFTVLDPSCGVGSFLTTFHQRATTAGIIEPAQLRLIGQDKVERMVRLSTINMALFDVGEHRIFSGNSLASGSKLDALNGKVDLILTNPPFGARFEQDWVKACCGANTPFFSGLKRTAANIDSELLFIDRNLTLLKDGGRLVIVVPDGVVSAKGIAALLRQRLATTCRLICVVELPAATFAQAGTRTKTTVVFLQKGVGKPRHGVLMATADDLGYQVASRKGVQIKLPQGCNELPDVLRAFSEGLKHGSRAPAILCQQPSCVVVPSDEVLRGSWTPSHYNVKRYTAIAALASNDELELVPLCELAEFCGDNRKVEAWTPSTAFISVLHILGDGFVDIASALAHAPKTPGTPTYPGELLVSRINPRIPRVCVTPDLDMRTLCSSEFEVLRCKDGVEAHALAYLLQTEVVQNQIRSLTSGTSASHNRIRTSELAQVLIPVAKPGSATDTALASLFDDYRAVSTALAQNALRLARLRQRDSAIFGAVD